MGGDHPVLLPLQQSIILIAFFTSVATLLSRHVPRFVIYPWLAMLIVAPGFWLRAIYVLPDLTMAYFVALAAITGILWLEEQRTAWLLLATLFIAAATLTKNEGLSLGGLLVIGLVGACDLRCTAGTASSRSCSSLASPHRAVASLVDEPGRSTATAEYDWHEAFHPHLLREVLALKYALLSMERWIFSGDVWLFVPSLVLVTLLIVAISRPALAIAVAGWLSPRSSGSGSCSGSAGPTSAGMSATPHFGS